MNKGSINVDNFLNGVTSIHLTNVEKYIKAEGLNDCGRKKYSGDSLSSASNLQYFKNYLSWKWLALTYILYLQNHLSNYHLEKMPDVDLMGPIIIKKTKTKIKAIW